MARSGRTSAADLRRARSPKTIPVAERRSIEGWQRIPGAAKRYRNQETGEELSNRQYRERFLYAGRSLETQAKARGAPRTRYTRLLHARQDYLAQHGIRANLQEIRQSQAMKDIIRELDREARRERSAKRKGYLTARQRKEFRGPDSPLARALADLGYRDHDARHYVGDS